MELMSTIFFLLDIVCSKIENAAIMKEVPPRRKVRLRTLPGDVENWRTARSRLQALQDKTHLLSV